MSAPLVGRRYLSAAGFPFLVTACMPVRDSSGQWVVLDQVGNVCYVDDDAEPLPPQPPSITLIYQRPLVPTHVVLPDGIVARHPGDAQAPFWCIVTGPSPDWAPGDPQYTDQLEFDRGFNGMHDIEERDRHDG